jgi:hypothetical protein
MTKIIANKKNRTKLDRLEEYKRKERRENAT